MGDPSDLVIKNAVTCQLLHELQGNVYLHSDVEAGILEIMIEQESKNRYIDKTARIDIMLLHLTRMYRVYISGVKGYPPPSTTKLAIFYRGCFQSELNINATGNTTERKYQSQEAHARHKLKEMGITNNFDTLEFQKYNFSLKLDAH